MIPIAEQKSAMRRMVRQLKKSYTADDLVKKSLGIVAKIELLEKIKNAKVILVYWSLPDEVFTHQFVDKYSTQKTMLLPKMDGHNLTLHQYKGADSLKQSSQFGIMEPVGSEFNDLTRIDVMIVPGMAFGHDYSRLGRGKGFYDRMLIQSGAYKIGLAFDFQMFASVPCEPHDIKLDEVVY